MKNLQNNRTAQIVAIVILLIVVSALVSKKGNNSGQNATSTATETSINTGTGNPSTSAAPKVTTTAKSSQSRCNFTITYPAAGSRVSFPLIVKGVIDENDSQKGKCAWYNIQSSAGTAQLFYNFNNYGWKSQGIAVPMTTTGTQVASTSAVTVTLNFLNQGVGLPSGSAMRITFVEFNPLSAPNPDTFDMTVYLK